MFVLFFLLTFIIGLTFAFPAHRGDDSSSSKPHEDKSIEYLRKGQHATETATHIVGEWRRAPPNAGSSYALQQAGQAYINHARHYFDQADKHKDAAEAQEAEKKHRK